MAPNKPKVGDRVLYRGEFLEIDSLSKNGDESVANCKQPELIARREDAKAELAGIRGRQTAADRSTAAGEKEWQKCAAEVRKIDADLRSVSFKMSLRSNLLTWVPDMECWGRNGHMLSADQEATFIADMGKKPLSGAGEVKALKYLG